MLTNLLTHPETLNPVPVLDAGNSFYRKRGL